METSQGISPGSGSGQLWRRRHVGFVFQFFNLIPTLTVGENVALPLELNHSRDFEAVGKLLARVGLADRAHSFPERLSGGEQQRVAMARALAHDPELILADEPTGNLDDETGESVLGLLGELLRERGKTLLVATHSQELLRLADRVFDLHDGQLVERAV
ncbi:ATP-binding cassette domain-containing protein [bacterium CPR1]|nr:ATP-binding cassette domain-containing protein [bacterium CPR1]